jgi:hypothetical protein
MSRILFILLEDKNSQSESDDPSSDSEKPSTNVVKPFSPLFLNNMKKFGVSTDWLAKRSNSIRHSSYSRSSIKSNTSQLDAMIKSASAKSIRSSRKLSFMETNGNEQVKSEFEKENIDPEKTNHADREQVQQTSNKVTSVTTTCRLILPDPSIETRRMRSTF